MKPLVRWSQYQSGNSICLANSQAEHPSPLRLLWEVCRQAIQKFLIEDPPEVQVWHTCDSSGNIWWHADDPSTGRAIYQVSEAEIRIWLEQRHRPDPKCMWDCDRSL